MSWSGAGGLGHSCGKTTYLARRGLKPAHSLKTPFSAIVVYASACTECGATMFDAYEIVYVHKGRL